MKRISEWLLPLAAACAMAAAQNFSWAAPAVFLGVVPLLAALRAGGFLITWARVSLFYSVYLLLTLSWLRLAGAGTGWLIPIAIVYSWLFLTIPAAALAGMKSASARLLMFAPAFAAAEVLARLTLFRITWNVLGQPLADYPALAQVAAIGGPEASTMLVLWVNAGLAVCLPPPAGRARRWGAMFAAGAAAIALLFGCLQLSTTPRAQTVLRAGVVQPMNSQRLVWTAANRGPLLERMDGLMDRVARRRPDLSCRNGPW